MKNQSKLIQTLYLITTLIFWFVILFTSSALYFDIFVKDGDIGNVSAGTHHSKGYPIKAKIQFHIPDTLIIFKGTDLSGVISKYDEKYDKEFKRIEKDSTLTKTYQIKKVSIHNDDREISADFGKYTDRQLSAEINTLVNPKDKLFKLILIFNTYLQLFFIAFIAFQFKKIFKQLKANFNFDQTLYKRIKIIGFSLIIYQLVQLLFSVFIQFKISRIEFEHFIPTVEHSSFKFMTLSTIPEFNFIPLFLGLSMLVLAKLLKYGSDLQQENELTI